MKMKCILNIIICEQNELTTIKRTFTPDTYKIRLHCSMVYKLIFIFIHIFYNDNSHEYILKFKFNFLEINLPFNAAKVGHNSAKYAYDDCCTKDFGLFVAIPHVCHTHTQFIK